MKMVKKHYFVSNRTEDRKHVVAECVEGYVVEKVVAGTVMQFGIRKCGKSWTVDELGTGMSCNPGHKFGKRAEALAYVEGKDAQTGKSLSEAFGKYLEERPYTYKAQVYALQVMQQRKTPWPLKEHDEYIGEQMRKFAEQAGVIKKSEEKKFPEKCEHEESRFTNGKVKCKKHDIWTNCAEVGHCTLADKVEAKAKEMGADVKVTVTEDADVTAVVIEPKKLTPPPVKAEKKEKVAAPRPPRKEDRLEDRVKELEEELRKRNAELEAVWKENEALKASEKATKPEKAPEPEKAPKHAEAAATVTLETLEAWCRERNLVASQKREGCCIWVEGDSKAYADELKEMGLRFAKKRKSWYYPAA